VITSAFAEVTLPYLDIRKRKVVSENQTVDRDAEPYPAKHKVVIDHHVDCQ
jgi:hypothetical protein